MPNDDWLVGQTVTLDDKQLLVEAAHEERGLRIHSLRGPDGEKYRYVPGMDLYQYA